MRSSFIQRNGIQRQLNIDYTPEQNGVAEAMNRTILNSFRSMLQSAKLEKRFWVEALSTAVYNRNRVISRSFPDSVVIYHR